ncbi:MAG: hypothetical protein ACRD0V_17260, partial [Acidimicrobiales bacterium]
MSRTHHAHAGGAGRRAALRRPRKRARRRVGHRDDRLADGAAGFGTLATHFTDHTIVTYDPRGVERRERTDPDLAVTPR